MKSNREKFIALYPHVRKEVRLKIRLVCIKKKSKCKITEEVNNLKIGAVIR